MDRAGQPGQGKAKKEKARKDIAGQDKESQIQEKIREGKVKEGREDQDKTRQVTSREMVPRKGDATLHVATNSQKVFRNRSAQDHLTQCQLASRAFNARVHSSIYIYILAWGVGVPHGNCFRLRFEA